MCYVILSTNLWNRFASRKNNISSFQYFLKLYWTAYMHYSNSQGLSYIIMVIYTGIHIFTPDKRYLGGGVNFVLHKRGRGWFFFQGGWVNFGMWLWKQFLCEKKFSPPPPQIYFTYSENMNNSNTLPW